MEKGGVCRMICWAVIILCGIIGYVAASNGSWVAFGICVAIAIGALIMSDNDQFRAEVNWRNYWSSSGKDRARMRRKWAEEAREEEERERETEQEKLARWRREDRERERDGIVRVQGVETDGTVEKVGETTQTCRICRGVMKEKNRIRYSSGTVYVTYKCEKCGHETPVKVK